MSLLSSLRNKENRVRLQPEMNYGIRLNGGVLKVLPQDADLACAQIKLLIASRCRTVAAALHLPDRKSFSYQALSIIQPDKMKSKIFLLDVQLKPVRFFVH